MSALSVSHGTMTPTFNSYTSDYTVPDVANADTQITIAAIPKTGYFVEFFDPSLRTALMDLAVNPPFLGGSAEANCNRFWGNTELTDADPNTAGFQVDLYDGDNPVSVGVYPTTYCDSAGTQYELEITRAQGPISVPRPNRPAIGHPSILPHVPCVGCTMSASVAHVRDADGMTNATFSYQWFADDVEIAGATSSSYTAAATDQGKTLTVRVTFTDDRGNEETRTSWPEGYYGEMVVQAFSNSLATGAPSISGTAQVGETLTADTSGIADTDGLANVSYGYQWIANDGAADSYIQNATGSSYTLVDANEGKTIKVKVSFTDDADNEETLTSAATAEVAAAAPTEPPGRPRNLTGTANSDGTVTLSWDAPDDDSVTGYHILRRKPDEGENNLLVHVNDTGSTATEYTDNDVTPDVRHAYRVKAINAIGLSRRSNFVNVTPAQPAEPAQNSPATGAPSISGTAQVGETLTADTSGIADTDGLANVSYSYQWVANDGTSDTDITDAADSAYTLAADDAGKTIMVKVSFIDDAGHGETLTSAATATVVAAPNSPATGAPGISGTAQVGETLTASTSGIADEDGLTNVTFSYQWLADDVAIQGATGYSHTLADSDAGKAIRVKASFSDDAGNPESLTSAATGAVAPRDPPPAPENLTAVQNADGSVTLTWDAPGDDSVTGYRILRRNADAGEHSLSVHVPDTGSDATSYTDTDVAAGAKYVYRVKAINEARVGPKSRRVMITTTG